MTVLPAVRLFPCRVVCQLMPCILARGEDVLPCSRAVLLALALPQLRPFKLLPSLRRTVITSVFQPAFVPRTTLSAVLHSRPAATLIPRPSTRATERVLRLGQVDSAGTDALCRLVVAPAGSIPTAASSLAQPSHSSS
ncbi:hypothetical protein BC939DRAFT_444206 [Gamsiella multidivaricata]|uniref:uncharacterized protein n=1 Tax=Gamsiella multidivaricata TaxID=101098 RepID=UPI0022210A40|nr:uncharacterized protein BC939DRAFT_444206 [Gamsiella multidivaricata]KAI7827978.1 hypothetical protein BC939DRAFT_444206 [Gamsiella multidivaricata]